MTERYKKLTLLHSNDMHGDFLAEKVNNELVGGVSMLYGEIKQISSSDQETLYEKLESNNYRETRGLGRIEIIN